MQSYGKVDHVDLQPPGAWDIDDFGQGFKYTANGTATATIHREEGSDPNPITVNASNGTVIYHNGSTVAVP